MRSNKKSEKEVTIYDIAEALQISPATVSRGLKDHPAIKQSTKERIRAQASKMGYRFNIFASNLRAKRTYTIGVIVPRLNSTFMADVLAGMERVANEAGYNLIISQSLESPEKEKLNVETMFNRRVDGLLVSLSYGTDSLDHFQRVIDNNIFVIFFDRVLHHPKCPRIVIDNRRAGYEMTEHLIQQGCRRIMHITGSAMNTIYRMRFEGYKDALREYGLPFEEDLLVSHALGTEEGVSTARQILEMASKPDGVFVANDTCAVACMLELKRNGVRVPQDIKIAGFNNDPVCVVAEPNLTTINYKGHEMGQIAAKTLIELLNDAQGVKNIDTVVLHHELIRRQSTALD